MNRKLGAPPALRRKAYFPHRDVRVAVYRESNQRPMHQHRHEFFEIAVVTHGSGVHVTGNFRHRIETGDVLVINSRRTHGFEETRGLSLINIMVRSDLLARLNREIGTLRGYHALFTLEPIRWNRQGYKGALRLNATELSQVVEWVDRLEQELKEGERGGSVLAEAYITLIVGLMARLQDGGRKRGPGRSVGRMGLLLIWMEREMQRPLTVAELAGRMAMSDRSFYRRFSETVGMPPLTYLLRIRLKHATELLLRKEEALSISEIAQSCGFSDSNYFSRYFRKAFGKSPREYRIQSKMPT
jgi:AraC-like DNA-binding protein